MTIISSLSQEESRSISENVTWGMRQGFAQGKIALPYSHFLGYRKGEDGPEVVPEEADVVRSIYRRYLDGSTPGMIAKELENAGIPSPTGKEKWHGTTINSMDAGRSNPDPAVQAKWAGFEYAGDEPTLEEFILWMAGQVR